MRYVQVRRVRATARTTSHSPLRRPRDKTMTTRSEGSTVTGEAGLSVSHSLYCSLAPPLVYKREETAPDRGLFFFHFTTTAPWGHHPPSEHSPLAWTPQDSARPEALGRPNQIIDQHTLAFMPETWDAHRSFSRPFVPHYCKLMHDTRVATN